MPTTKTRLNITLSDELHDALSAIAKRDKVPQATKVVELLMNALELEEDTYWADLVAKRDKKGSKFVSFTLWK